MVIETVKDMHDVSDTAKKDAGAFGNDPRLTYKLLRLVIVGRNALLPIRYQILRLGAMRFPR